jgi:hypothetical protein
VLEVRRHAMRHPPRQRQQHQSGKHQPRPEHDECDDPHERENDQDPPRHRSPAMQLLCKAHSRILRTPRDSSDVRSGTNSSEERGQMRASAVK